MGQVACTLQLACVAAAMAAGHDAGAAGSAGAAPRECRARADAPYLPIFHVVGNITDSGTGKGFKTESINDVSGVVRHLGVYHIFHQCCQNHWDHLVSSDLVRWTRLPPPIRPSADPHEWYDSKGSYDGSVSMLPAEQGGPVILYDAMHGPRPNGSRLGDDRGWLAVARPQNASDPYLVDWVKDRRNPCYIHEQGAGGGTGQPADGPVFPSAIWRSGDHFNFLSSGDRFTTTDPSFMNWTRVRSNSSGNPGGRFMREGSPGTGPDGQ